MRCGEKFRRKVRQITMRPKDSYASLRKKCMAMRTARGGDARGIEERQTMRRNKRVLVIGSDSHYGQAILVGIHNYCRVHHPWELHLERDSTAESLKRARTAIRDW